MRSIEEVMADVAKSIENRKDEILAMGDYFWRNPEPGYKEFKTSKYAADKLRAMGLNVREHLAITGFRADIDTGRPGPTVAILGELDSLVLPNHPECDKETGAVHSCGHNAQMAGLVGTAMGLLDANAPQELCGKIALIACPAEEGIEMDYRKDLMAQGKIKSIAGKSQLLREGVFDDVDISYMNHLAGGFGYYDHNGCVNKKITFRGKCCHASSPQNGINALNASSLAQHAIGLMRESLSNDDKARIHGIITNGGTAVNIIPDEVTMEFMVRAPSIEAIQKLSRRFDNIVLYAAKAAECTAQVETVNGYMPLIDNPELGNVLRDTVAFVSPGAAFGANTSFSCGCTDMGDVATVIPGVHGYVPGSKGTAHGTDYRIADPYSAYVINSKVQAVAAVKLLYGNAEKGKEIAAMKNSMMTIPDYIKTIDGINTTLTTENMA